MAHLPLGGLAPEPTAAGALDVGRAAVLRRAARELAQAGCETPRLDAEILLAHALGCSRERLLLDAPRELDAASSARFAELLRRRALAREPVAYIVGTRAFRGLQLRCDTRALVPRAETELLVECALELPAGARVLDLGTGSGAVALALASERPDLDVSASDISPQALELARENAAHVGAQLTLLRTNLLHGVPDEFDAILANLPYVAACERDTLAPEIVRHEPATALYGGPEGTELIAALAGQLRARRRVRMVALEVGAGQAARVRELILAAGFAGARALRDLAGIERVVIGEART